MDIIINHDANYPAYSVAYTGTAGNTTAWNVDGQGVKGVFLWSTTDCYVRVGTSAVATSADLPLPAYTPITLPINRVDVIETFRVSAIQISAGGTIYAKPIFNP